MMVPAAMSERASGDRRSDRTLAGEGRCADGSEGGALWGEGPRPLALGIGCGRGARWRPELAGGWAAMVRPAQKGPEPEGPGQSLREETPMEGLPHATPCAGGSVDEPDQAARIGTGDRDA